MGNNPPTSEKASEKLSSYDRKRTESYFPSQLKIEGLVLCRRIPVKFATINPEWVICEELRSMFFLVRASENQLGIAYYSYPQMKLYKYAVIPSLKEDRFIISKQTKRIVSFSSKDNYFRIINLITAKDLGNMTAPGNIASIIAIGTKLVIVGDFNGLMIVDLVNRNQLNRFEYPQKRYCKLLHKKENNWVFASLLRSEKSADIIVFKWEKEKEKFTVLFSLTNNIGRFLTLLSANTDYACALSESVSDNSLIIWKFVPGKPLPEYDRKLEITDGDLIYAAIIPQDDILLVVVNTNSLIPLKFRFYQYTAKKFLGEMTFPFIVGLRLGLRFLEKENIFVVTESILESAIFVQLRTRRTAIPYNPYTGVGRK